MKPKTEKRRVTQEERKISLSDAINTNEWNCVVTLVLEGAQSDVILTKKFAEMAASGSRRALKSIDFDYDVKDVLKQFAAGDINYRYSYLLNFSSIFEKAAEYESDIREIPVPLLVQIIKALIFLLKKNHADEETTRKECNNDPIKIMASKPFSLEGTDTKSEERKKSLRTSDKNSKEKIKVRPPAVAKEDTELLRRNERPKKAESVDDAPEDSYYQMYIALTGFSHPELALEMIKQNIPLHSIICVSQSDNQSNFWTKFLRLIWSPDIFHYFNDVIFQVFRPQIPAGADLGDFIYREISYLMYDLSDLKQQHKNYLSCMKLRKVDDIVSDYQHLSFGLDRLPHECMSIPIILQSLLDTLCGEDYAQLGHPGEDIYIPSTGTPSTYLITSFSDASDSLASLIPFKSTPNLETPRWSTELDTEEARSLYEFIKELDILYGIEESNDILQVEMTDITEDICTVKIRRLPCRNLDFALQDPSPLLSSFWRNYPKKDNDKVDDKAVNPSDIVLNYCMYIIWISRLDCGPATVQSLPSVTEIDSVHSARFTITDGARIRLNKIHRPFTEKNFFSPSELKIMEMSTLSAPELRRIDKCQPTFVSNCHIPTKYLSGTPMCVYDDLRQFIGEEAFKCLKGYDLVEELNRNNLIQRMEESAVSYDSIYHAYSPLTNSIYVVMTNVPGLERKTYNVSLTTPVGLRDFYDYILDDERRWLEDHKSPTVPDKETCPDPLYHPTPTFRDFPESEFWSENSIKYAMHTHGLWEEEEPIQLDTTEEDEMYDSMTRAPSEAFEGFELGSEALQYSGLDTTYRGAGGCSIKASLRERLYGSQELGVHVQQGGHNLHLYSYVCPTPHVSNPYTFHLEYKNGIIIAFTRWIDSLKVVDSNSSEFVVDDVLTSSELEEFAYNAKLSLPNGMTVETVRKSVRPCYIKQTNSLLEEKSRLLLPNGNIVKMMKNNTVQVLGLDSSIADASLDDLELMIDEEEYSPNGFKSFEKTLTDGCRVCVMGSAAIATKRFQIIRNTEVNTQTAYCRRMDGTNYAVYADGTTCVEFADGSKIAVQIGEENFRLQTEEEDFVEYVIVYRKIVMEHPKYATVIFNDRRKPSWSILLPGKSQIEIDASGEYHVDIDERTELDVTAKEITMCRYGPGNELVMKTVANLTAFEEDKPRNIHYCTTIDSNERTFIINGDSNCEMLDSEEGRKTDPVAEKRYFVVRRDLSGFEIMNVEAAQREMDSAEPEVIIHSQGLETNPPTRYFVFLQGIPDTKNEWTMPSITPEAKWPGLSTVMTSSTYGIPPTWMLPFPKKKKKLQIPQTLSGRILLELQPTTCHVTATEDYAYCDLPDAEPPLTDVPEVMRKVANQDQVTLQRLYTVAVTSKRESERRKPKGSPALERYLEIRRYNIQLRQFLKDAIRYKRIPNYFDSPEGIAWSVWQSIFDSIFKVEKIGSETQQESTITTSEIEYDLEWSSEPSFSDLSYRSHLSLATAPDVVTKKPICSRRFQMPRNAESEPANKMADFKSIETPSVYDLSVSQSHMCTFTQEDLLMLEKSATPKEVEPVPPSYELEDLIKLGLV